MLSYIALIGAFMSSTAIAKKSKSTYTYCYDYSECENETITTTYASCYGYYGCNEANIDSSYTLAYGELGCYSADIESTYTYAYGHYGSYGASISTYNLFGYGYEASKVADIEPYSTTLNIYFYGYFAGDAADVSCYSGDTCHLYCGSGHGCYQVDFYCYSGATCYYDCSGDDVCPTSYSGVDADLTYVTSAGTATVSSGSSNLGADVAILFTGLTDEEINQYKLGNQIFKDKSKRKLEQDTIDDTNGQKHMTYDQEFWFSRSVAKKAQRERNEEERRKRDQEREERDDREQREREHERELKEEQYAKMQHLKNSKHGGRSISLKEYGVGFIIDIVIIGIVMQTYDFCIKPKTYQSL